VPITPRDTPKRATANQKSLAEEENVGDDYEVEEIINHKVVKDETLYLVRWKGYASTQNTWEPESSLSCPALIKKYQAKKKSSKGKSAAGKKSSKKTTKNAKVSEPAYEVEKIVDEKVEKGKRFFLIRWKGYGANDDTWEPEVSLSCPDVVKKFLDGKKNAKKGKKAAVVPEEENYEVEKVVDDKTEKGKKFYLVKWKGYSDADNTWEPESSLSCPDLVAKYNNSKPKSAKGRGTKRSAPAPVKESKPAKKGKKEAAVQEVTNGDDDEKEWEVKDIVDVRTSKAGTKEYLIRWKDCKPSEDTWEPEDQVNCPEIIARFEKSIPAGKTTKTKAKKSTKRA